MKIDQLTYRQPMGRASLVPGMTQTTMCVFSAASVPVGTELFVQPKDSRLMLEVEVANENAAHHKQISEKRGNEIHNYRRLLRGVRALFLAHDIDFRTPESQDNFKKIRDLIEKELG